MLSENLNNYHSQCVPYVLLYISLVIGWSVQDEIVCLMDNPDNKLSPI